eukprot:gnl/TRDRNA2_/TRDRNA2_59231_c1_seq1.p1 gnl/TRDRNA2_/TRDRNA2_59231_c1~~gnl/TRDRNA2_/TRDRNA2_59231_c1_seq1.p1  ORF type:complete len:388 (+),score=94.59 gnl/TRDRNA2_/TRDRNA2_59231_c1_seq1:78-1166(+)
MSGDDGRRRKGAWGGIGKVWKAMNEWGDEFERRNFDGDFVGALGGAPKKAWSGLNEFGEEFERRHFDGDFLSAIDRTVDRVNTAATQMLGDDRDEDMGATDSHGNMHGVGSSSGSSSVHRPPPPVSPPRSSCASGPPNAAVEASFPSPAASGSGPGAASVPGLWEQARTLQAELAKEQEHRQGRIASLRSLDAAVQGLRSELMEERRECAKAEAERKSAEGQLDSAENVLEDLQERHYALLGRKAAQEAELRRFSLAAAVRDHADREELRVRSRRDSWARDGQELEALKEAKVALAEVLGCLDEARLQSRRELAALQQEVEAAQEENIRLRQGYDNYVAPKSFKDSIRRLVSVAVGKGEQSS